jgi:hypothetical protein
MGDEERAAAIDQLRRRLSEATVRKAALVSEAEHLAARIGQVREALGNPYFYSGPAYDRPENADDSIARFTGYKSHEPALRLVRRIQAANLELKALREQLRELGASVE